VNNSEMRKLFKRGYDADKDASYVDRHSAGLRAVVAAAKKEAWDEGYESGVDDESFTARGSLSDPDAAEHPHDNPYATDTLAAAHTTDLREQSKLYAASPRPDSEGE